MVWLDYTKVSNFFSLNEKEKRNMCNNVERQKHKRSKLHIGEANHVTKHS